MVSGAGTGGVDFDIAESRSAASDAAGRPAHTLAPRGIIRCPASVRRCLTFRADAVGGSKRPRGARGEVPVARLRSGTRRRGSARTGTGGAPGRRPSPTHAIAELRAIRAAAAVLGAKRLVGVDIYVTLMPARCCAQAIACRPLRRELFRRL